MRRSGPATVVGVLVAVVAAAGIWFATFFWGGTECDKTDCNAYHEFANNHAELWVAGVVAASVAFRWLVARAWRLRSGR